MMMMMMMMMMMIVPRYDNWDECLNSNSNASGVLGTRDATYGQGANISFTMLLRDSSAGVMIGALHTEAGVRRHQRLCTYIYHYLKSGFVGLLVRSSCCLAVSET